MKLRQSGENFMRLPATTVFLFAMIIAAAGITSAKPAHADEPYCSNPAHSEPEKVPADLIALVAKAFETDTASVRNAAFVRCVGTTLMGCYVGANLICDKADTRRAIPGATAWCQAHPGSIGIPMSATGHATIYDWSCKGSSAVAGRAVLTVDRQGYIADNWKEIR